MQSYISNVFMTGIMSEWVMSTIEDNSATPRVQISVRAWIEPSRYGKEDQSQNMMKMCSWLTRNKQLNTGVAIFHIQVKMLLMLNQV